MTLEDFLPDTVIEMIREGEAKGKNEGKTEGKIFSISKLLKKKFKNKTNKEIASRLENLSLDKLEKVEEMIIDRIFTLDSWKEVEEILNSVS